jgi:5'-3' exonuclease
VSRSIKLLLVDALNLIRRVYAAQPGDDGPERVEGALVASLQSLRRGVAECAPTHAVCVFEGEGKSWRHELHDGYKAGHAPIPEPLGIALDRYREAFAELGVESLSIPHLEADDVIATLASKASAAGAAVIILSTDKIFLQLLPRGVLVRDHFRSTDLDQEYVVEKFGVQPSRLTDLLALAGDHGNGIPGVPGVGPKTAASVCASIWSP